MLAMYVWGGAISGKSTTYNSTSIPSEQKKTKPLLFRRRIWMFLTNFNNFSAVSLRNDQRAYLASPPIVVALSDKITVH